MLLLYTKEHNAGFCYWHVTDLIKLLDD